MIMFGRKSPRVPDAPGGDPCRCQLGCPAVATRRGYDRQMTVVPVAVGHGRRGDGSWPSLS